MNSKNIIKRAPNGGFIVRNGGARIKTAVILAAGTGSRLRPLTERAPKCLTVIGGQTILGRLVANLRQQGIDRLVVVTGHLSNQIREFLDRYAADLRVDYVLNPLYQTTNNIYSLWLARGQVQEDFLLVESDLVFDASMLKNMLIPNRIAVSKMLDWMNGTTVAIDSKQQVSSFHSPCDEPHGTAHKTVNIYSLGLEQWRKVIARLDVYIESHRLGEYYEVVLAELINSASIYFEAVFFNEHRWYEVDTLEDLENAERMFTPSVPIRGLRGTPATTAFTQRPVSATTIDAP